MNIWRVGGQSAILFVFLVLTACAGHSVGTPFNWEDTEKIQIGMTESEVVAILGKPYARNQEGNKAQLIWTHATSFGGVESVAYRFEDGLVIEQSSTVGK